MRIKWVISGTEKFITKAIDTTPVEINRTSVDKIAIFSQVTDVGRNLTFTGESLKCVAAVEHTLHVCERWIILSTYIAVEIFTLFG